MKNFFNRFTDLVDVVSDTTGFKATITKDQIEASPLPEPSDKIYYVELINHEPCILGMEDIDVVEIIANRKQAED